MNITKGRVLRKSINLWLLDPSTEPPQAKQYKSCESHLEKMDELQKIVDILKDKHKEGKYSYLWGNIIQLGHHDSYEHPPNKPLFGATTGKAI